MPNNIKSYAMLKNLIITIDDVLFSKMLRKWYGRLKAKSHLMTLESGLEFKVVSYYKKNNNCEISRLCDTYGSDKGELRAQGHPYVWPSHTYADFYARAFYRGRNSVKKVFECGLGTNNPNLPSSMGIAGKPGASLRVWRDFFPNATVYGADIDKDVLFEDERIKTFYIDQLNPTAIERYWETVGEKDFDLMVDDGLHTFEAGATLFKHSIDKLAADGIYVIEDVVPADLVRFKDFFAGTDYIVEYMCMYRPNSELVDNSLVVVRKQS